MAHACALVGGLGMVAAAVRVFVTARRGQVSGWAFAGFVAGGALLAAALVLPG
jgi:hypothetical protein